MRVDHTIYATIDLRLGVREATAFVQAVERSLSEVSFLKGLHVTPLGGERRQVQAAIPLQVPLVGAYDLRFSSALEATPCGAKLHALPLDKTAWAEISGQAEVTAIPGGSRAHYQLELLVHIDLPEPERWGPKALLKMVDVTAQRVIENVTADFPQALERAVAREERALCPA